MQAAQKARELAKLACYSEERKVGGNANPATHK
jgi:hypothetical protein